MESQEFYGCLHQRQILWGLEIQPGVDGKIIKETTKQTCPQTCCIEEALLSLISVVLYSKADSSRRTYVYGHGRKQY